METIIPEVVRDKIIPASQSVVPQFEITVDENKRRIEQVRQFVKSQMKEGEDYGVIPGVERPSLLKPGAEKLCNIFGFGVEVQEVDKLEDWDKGIFAYSYRAVIRNKRTGLVESECIGSCNSKEAKYAFRWMPDFKASEQDKARSDKQEVRQAKSGKSFTWFRVPNEDIFSQVNTLQKMAQKRAMVGAVLIATRASGFLTQDMEDTVQEDSYPQNPTTGKSSPTTATPTAQPSMTELTLKSRELLKQLGVGVGSQIAFENACMELVGLKPTNQTIAQIVEKLQAKVDEIPTNKLSY